MRVNQEQVCAVDTRQFPRRAVIGWLLYDWANSAFALSVMTAFFPVMFKLYWCAGQDASFSTIRLNLANSVAGLCIALLAPLVGALADAGRSRKLFLVVCMLLGVVSSAALSIIPQSAWPLALGVFIGANVGFACANLFYDSLLPCVACPGRMDIISSSGFAVGYIGCALLYSANLLMITHPSWFGFADKLAATRAAFLTVSAWWLLFSVPLILWVKEPARQSGGSLWPTVVNGVRQLGATARDIMGHRALWLFLVAYWLYIDGVDTFIRAAADLGLSIGLDQGGLMVSLLVVQIVAFPFAYLFGLLAGRIGARNALLIGIALFVFVTIGGPLTVHTPLQFGVFAALSAMPLGALQALSRSYWARMIPAEKSAEYFGFYSLMGKFSVMFGPALVALVAAMVRRGGGDSAMAARLGCTSLTVFFVAGGVLLVLAGRVAAQAPARQG
jgi:MFS transporter, UMF1 family